MKTLGGIGAIILGIVAIVVSFGLQTIWAPPAVFNATTPAVEQAPLTIITEGIDIDPNDSIEYTVQGDGEFTLMYGQLRDIEAWVGDAAHNVIDGVDTDVARGEDPTVHVTHVEGGTEVPNPVNSDLWLATQEVTDEVTQRWASADAGEWALLVAVDGSAPAPTQLSVSWVNVEPNSPWIIPLMITGIVLIVLGIVLLILRFMEFRRRAKRTSGRRAKVRGDYTGLTAADVMTNPEANGQQLDIEQVDTGNPVPEIDQTQATQIVAGLPITDDTDPADDALTGSDPAAADLQEEHSATPHAPGTADEAGHEDDDTDGTDDTDTTPDTDGMPPVEEDSSDAASPATNDDTEPKGPSFLRRTITAISALGLTIGMGVGPAHAESQTRDDDISEQVDDEQLQDDVEPAQPETFPVVVDAQFDAILNAVASTAAAADEDLNPDILPGRLAGHALTARRESYRANALDEDYPSRYAIGADEILATWMDRDDSFPRTMYTVTADTDEGSTQLLVLQQNDARSQYQLIHNAPFAPDLELPTSTLLEEGVENLTPDESTDLVMSPEAAVEALSQYLDDPDADAADSIADHEWIDSIHQHQDDLVETHSDNDVNVSVSRSIFDDSIMAVRLPNGQALVFGTMNSLESLTPQDGATVDVPTVVQEIGEFDTAAQEDRVRIRYREQFALLVPADGEVSLAGYETVLSTVD